ncbi:hypothetical protein ACO2I3_19010 [Leptospira interrogans]
MAHVEGSRATPVATDIPSLEWSAVFAGAFLAAAISFVLLTFGTAIGLSATSPWPHSGLSASVLAGIAVFWIMAQQIGAFMAGGYVAGRMRTGLRGASADEVQFRDGLHGGLVWAVGIVVGAALAMATASAVTRTTAQVVGGAAATAAASSSDIVVDRLLRPQTTAQPSNETDVRSEVGRVLAGAVVNGSLTSQDRTYLAQLVAQRTGVTAEEADKRINEAFNAAREAADKARKAAVLTGFVTAASLLISLAAAWWASIKDGHHRDHSVPVAFTFARREE